MYNMCIAKKKCCWNLYRKHVGGGAVSCTAAAAACDVHIWGQHSKGRSIFESPGIPLYMLLLLYIRHSVQEIYSGAAAAAPALVKISGAHPPITTPIQNHPPIIALESQTAVLAPRVYFYFSRKNKKKKCWWVVAKDFYISKPPTTHWVI